MSAERYESSSIRATIALMRDYQSLLKTSERQAAQLAAIRDLANSAGRCGWKISADEIRKTLAAS